MARALLALFLALLLSACGSAPQRGDPPLPLANVDLQRYMGEWHIIANVPYFAERGNVMTRAGYRLAGDGRIEDVYYYRREFDGRELQRSTTATVVPGSGNAHWRVRFYGVLEADYLVLEVGEAYDYALVGHPGREYAWVLARTPRIDDALYARLLARLDELGFDSSQMRRIAQQPDDVGRDGFQW
jgi:apolipoprotein D and lipocalin family protein